jgi:hypothetical protein
MCTCRLCSFSQKLSINNKGEITLGSCLLLRLAVALEFAFFIYGRTIFLTVLRGSCGSIRSMQEDLSKLFGESLASGFIWVLQQLC